MLNLTMWCKELSLSRRVLEFDGMWQNSSRFSRLWNAVFYCMLLHAVCGEVDGYHVFATLSPTKIQNSFFFCDANCVLSCTLSRKLCCQLRPLTPCPNSTSHMDLALANNAGWPEQWEEALERELLSPSHHFCNSWASRWPHISVLGMWLSEPSSRGSLWKYSLCFWALQPLSLWAYITTYLLTKLSSMLEQPGAVRASDELWQKRETCAAATALHVFACSVFPPVDSLV